MDGDGPVDDTMDTIDALDVMRIMEMIPHRSPFLLIDRVEKLKPFHGAVGIKCVTVNEPFFQGHFPSRPVMPGVLIIEAMAQTAAVVVVQSLGKNSEGKLVYFMSVENARFRRPVTPGDRMEIRVARIQNRRTVWKFSGEAWVDGTKVAEAVYTAMILDG